MWRGELMFLATSGWDVKKLSGVLGYIRLRNKAFMNVCIPTSDTSGVHRLLRGHERAVSKSQGLTLKSTEAGNGNFGTYLRCRGSLVPLTQPPHLCLTL